MVLRRMRRDSRRDRDWDRVHTIDRILSEQDLEELVGQGLKAEYEFEMKQFPGRFDEYLKQVFAWLWEHREEIIRLALLIIQVVAILEPPPEIKEDVDAAPSS